MFYFVASVVLVLDIVFKKIALIKLSSGLSFPLIKGFLHFSLVRNTGVAFGLFPNTRPFLMLIGVIVCAGVIYYANKLSKDNFIVVFGLALILGGSLGNLVDRVFYGYVVDYIDFRSFPVFNLADIAINLGIAVIIYDVYIRRNCCTRS